MTATYDDAVRAWAAELREGSTRTWAEFLTSPAAGTFDHDPLPTAAQLEVARRLNLAGRGSSGLVDLVLATPAGRRGRIDVPLPWSEAPAFGTPPVEPDRLHPDELLRVLGSAIASLLQDEDVPESPQRKGRTLFKRRFVLLGAPSSARIVRAELLRHGLVEGGPKPTYVVLGGPLEMLLAQRWAARVRQGSTIRWRRFWRYLKTHDRIPPGVQAASLADGLARQTGGERVHLVLAGSTQEAMDVVGEIFGLPQGKVAEPAEIIGTDLLRVVNAPLTLAVGEARRARMVEQLWPTLTEGEEPRRLGVPRPHLDWAVDAAEREVERIIRGNQRSGYAVHGDPRIVVPDPGEAVPRAVNRQETLDLGLTVLQRAWTRRTGGQH